MCGGHPLASSTLLATTAPAGISGRSRAIRFFLNPRRVFSRTHTHATPTRRRRQMTAIAAPLRSTDALGASPAVITHNHPPSTSPRPATPRSVLAHLAMVQGTSSGPPGSSFPGSLSLYGTGHEDEGPPAAHKLWLNCCESSLKQPSTH